MRIPMLNMTILSVSCSYKDLVGFGSYTMRPIEYNIDRIEGEWGDIPVFYEEDPFDFPAFRHQFKWILRMIASFGSPRTSKFMSRYTRDFEMDDQMASETIYTDYMRAKNQHIGGSEGLYQGLKEAVHEIVITNVHLIQTTEAQRLQGSNAYNASGNAYILHTDPATGERTVETKQPNIFIPNENAPDECKALGGLNISASECSWAGSDRGSTGGSDKGVCE